MALSRQFEFRAIFLNCQNPHNSIDEECVTVGLSLVSRFYNPVR